jgi:hypothetical protein
MIFLQGLIKYDQDISEKRDEQYFAESRIIRIMIIIIIRRRRKRAKVKCFTNYVWGLLDHT